jgi:1-acyl-sn-glycerol-3-phosphate acyltransferase
MTAAAPRLPVLPPLVPRRGNPVSRAFGRAVFFALGWRVDGNLPNCAKCVMIAAPHTSTADIVVAMAAKVALGIHINWLGKHTVHRPPLGWLLKYMGAVPVDRTAPHGVVGQIVEKFRSEPAFFLGLAPEGTRRRTTTWKSGFHRAAHLAGVPIVTLALDYSTRTLWVGPPFTATNDFAADLAVLRQRFNSAMACRPERYADPEVPMDAHAMNIPCTGDLRRIDPRPSPDGE